jgi:phage baseplate assembly protein W
MAFQAGTPGAIRAVPPTAGFFGQGVKYPLTLTASGRLALSFGPDCVGDALNSIVSTAPMERVMQPDYGAAVLTFDLVDPDRSRIAIGRNIADHEPRIVRSDISAEQGADLAQSEVTIKYVLIGEANVRTETYPFFVPPPTTSAAGI